MWRPGRRAGVRSDVLDRERQNPEWRTIGSRLELAEILADLRSDETGFRNGRIG
jgi:hypothetical protein